MSIPRVSTQQLINAGINGFAVSMFVESIRRFKDWRTSPPFSFSHNGVKITIEPDVEGAGPDRYDEGKNENNMSEVIG